MMDKKGLVAFLKAARLTATDNVALQGIDLYDEWKPNMDVEEGDRLRYGDKLYKVRVGKAHTTQADWTPDKADSLFEVVNETHAGTLEDPIPYDKNMAVFKDKYYLHNGVIYLCTRDSGNPLYADPDTLIGNYFEVV